MVTLDHFCMCRFSGILVLYPLDNISGIHIIYVDSMCIVTYYIQKVNHVCILYIYMIFRYYVVPLVAETSGGSTGLNGLYLYSIDLHMTCCNMVRFQYIRTFV